MIVSSPVHNRLNGCRPAKAGLEKTSIQLQIKSGRKKFLPDYLLRDQAGEEKLSKILTLCFLPAPMLDCSDCPFPLKNVFCQLLNIILNISETNVEWILTKYSQSIRALGTAKTSIANHI